MAKLTLCVLIMLASMACNAQDDKRQDHQHRSIKNAGAQIGGPCEGCEAIYEWGDNPLLPVDTLPEFGLAADPLKITGTIYKQDAKTPAAGVILYIYHTNPAGIYPTRGNEKGWDRRHGYLRGWIKTAADGKYTFYTQRPGSYPSRSGPAHIHATLKEPGKNEYYIDEYLFTGDPLLKQAEADEMPKGGSGIVTLSREGNLWVARRDIILGLNIENYQ